MGVFGALFGCRGDGSFIGPLLWVSGGVGGFNVAMLSRLVRDIRRPTRSDVGASAKKFAQHTKNGSKWVFDGALGELLRENAAGGVVRGELLRENAAGGAVPGEYSSRTSTRGTPPSEFVAPCAWQPDPSTGSVNPSMRS